MRGARTHAIPINEAFFRRPFTRAQFLFIFHFARLLRAPRLKDVSLEICSYEEVIVRIIFRPTALVDVSSEQHTSIRAFANLLARKRRLELLTHA